MSLLVGAASNVASGYPLNDSLRFRASANAYLGRTPSSGGNQKTWTFSCWTKRGNIVNPSGAAGGVSQVIFGAANSANSQFLDVTLNGNNVFEIDILDSNSTRTIRTSTAVFRDPSAWYHFVIAIDTTQSTDTNRIKIYVNNELISTTAGTGTYPALNADTQVNATTGIHAIARRQGSADRYYDGYITEVNLIDGTALTPSAFGEYNEDTGVWQPRKYNSSSIAAYGTNGFLLNFSDSSSVAALGTDSSGNSNTWTVNNVSLTSGATYDLMSDVPTLTDEDTSNFATLNPVDGTNWLTQNGGFYISNGGLTYETTVQGAMNVATIASNSGKFYYETVVTNYNAAGIRATRAIPTGDLTYRYYANNGEVRYIPYNSTSATVLTTVATATSGDVIGVAVDLDSNTISWYKNNSLLYTATSIVADTYAPAVAAFANQTGATVNFGQQPFTYTPPTGYKKWNTFNLADSTITKGSDYMNNKLWTGNGTNQDINVGWDAGLIWYRNRTDPSGGVWTDIVRGDDLHLQTSNNNAQGSFGDMEFITDGYNVAGNSNLDNESAHAYVGWQWLAGGTGSSNGDGSITSTVSVNTKAGFSVVRYSGNATSGATVGHGLGLAPEIVIGKTLDTGGYDWSVYATAIGDATKVLTLNLNIAAGVETNKYNGTAPSATVVTLGNHGTNLSGTNNQILYCFAPIEGFSKFGSYVGTGGQALVTGAGSGAFIYTGFRPVWIMMKDTDTGDWLIYDTSRNVNNLSGSYMAPNTTDAEGTEANGIDILSNGFKQQNTFTNLNSSGNTYIYMAFAENPFKNSIAR